MDRHDNVPHKNKKGDGERTGTEADGNRPNKTDRQTDEETGRDRQTHRRGRSLLTTFSSLQKSVK